MRTSTPEKILKISDDIAARGSESLTRLTVLKKWFEQRPCRLSAFGLWIARRAAGRKGRTAGRYGALLDEARALMGTAATRESLFQQLDRQAAAILHRKARQAQNEYQSQPWGPVRIIHCWPLMLVEQGLALHLGQLDRPADGYKLVADWAQNYDSSHGNSLNGPSAGKLEELARWMFTVEALEEDETKTR